MGRIGMFRLLAYITAISMFAALALPARTPRRSRELKQEPPRPVLLSIAGDPNGNLDFTESSPTIYRHGNLYRREHLQSDLESDVEFISSGCGSDKQGGGREGVGGRANDD